MYMFAFHRCKKCAVPKYVKIHLELVLEAVALIVLLRVMVQNTSEVLCIPLSFLIPSLSPSPCSLYFLHVTMYIFIQLLSLSLSLSRSFLSLSSLLSLLSALYSLLSPLSSLLSPISLSPRLKFSLNVYLPNHEVIIQRVFTKSACVTMTSVWGRGWVGVVTHTHTHTHTHNTHTHTHTHTHTSHTNTHTHTCVSVYVCVSVFMCVCVCMCV
jgi:hypothetical protein